LLSHGAVVTAPAGLQGNFNASFQANPIGDQSADAFLLPGADQLHFVRAV